MADEKSKSPTSPEADARIQARRQCAFSHRGKGSKIKIDGEWRPLDEATRDRFVTRGATAGLALSGGGIRSATISLGLVEALASRGRFYGFDLMSTVSGGGYCGSFVRSLFVERGEGAGRKENEALLDDRFAFADATLCSFPDQQFFRSKAGYSGFLKAGKTIKNPLWWLRENGRYLAPGGMSDYGYALSYMVRNWITLLLVLLGCMVVIFAALQLAVLGLIGVASGRWPALTGEWLPMLQGWGVASPFVPIAGMMMFAGTGIAGAYWLSLPLPYARSSGIASEQAWQVPAGPVARRWAMVASLVVSLAIAGILFAEHVSGLPARNGLATAAAVAIGIVLVAGLSTAAINWARCPLSSVDFRREQTRWLTGYNMLFVIACALAAIDNVALALRPVGLNHGLGPVTVGSGLLASITSFLVAKAPDWIGKDVSGLRKALIRHADLAALVAALVILVSIALVADLLVIKLMWQGPAWANGGRIDWWTLGTAIAPVLVLVVLFGQSTNFANLSALTPLYSSRLTRAYIGASNAHRLDVDQRSDVTHGLVGDDMSIQAYMEKPTPAPLHLINITRNRTVGDKVKRYRIEVDEDDPLIREEMNDPRGRLASYESGITLHDRHGDRVVFGPYGVRVGAEFFDWKNITDPPSLGLLCAVSGAAVGSGMGRQTSLGTAMALTLANVRLGYWWREQSRKAADRVRLAFLPGLRCLYHELLGQFGSQGFWQLSDGGHSENSGALSLLERGCALIVVCDNGQDSTFSFADLEIFIRTARTDIGLEVAVVSEEGFPNSLANVKNYFFNGADGDWRKRVKAQDDEAFALLLQATDIPYRLNGEWTWRYKGASWIVWLKPNRFANLPADIATYAEIHPDFPQQSTENQFFDEAQWESYRRLGFEMGRRLFFDDDTLAQELPVIFGMDARSPSPPPPPPAAWCPTLRQRLARTIASRMRSACRTVAGWT